MVVLAFLPQLLAVFDQFEEWVSSDWSYLAIFAVSAIDAFFPLVPAETVVITAGVLAGTGDLQLWLVILCASAGSDVLNSFCVHSASIRDDTMAVSDRVGERTLS